jgi:DNA-binding transcriptional LysR family regulator
MEFRSMDGEPESEQPAASLYYLRTFQRVATERSFTRAGRALSLSQPAVSAQIRALERYYQGPLFETRHRRVYLTAEGEALFAYTERVFNLLDEASRDVAATRRAKRGSLRLGASTTLGVYLLPVALGGYTVTHPEIEIDIAIGTSTDVIGWVRAEKVPFGLVEAPLTHRDLDVHAVGQDEMVLIAAPNHPLARRDIVEPQQLADMPILRREPGSATQALVDTALERVGVRPPTLMNLGNTEALKQAVLAHVGLAWVPRVSVLRELRTGELARVPVRGVTIRRTYSVLQLHGTRLAPIAEQFLALLQQAAD